MRLEIAPAVAATDVQRQQADSSPVHHEPVVTQTVTEVYTRRDGRSARKTNRTLAFATRVTPAFDQEIRDIAEREGLKLVEVLEKAVEAYKGKTGLLIRDAAILLHSFRAILQQDLC